MKPGRQFDQGRHRHELLEEKVNRLSCNGRHSIDESYAFSVQFRFMKPLKT